MVEQGADTFQLVPVKDWDYKIFKVTYFRDEACKHEIKSGYIMSTPGHIESEVEDHGGCSWGWCTWDPIEDLQGKVPFGKGVYGHPQSYGYGLYDSVVALKKGYKISSSGLS
jgi:hypothetical protein